MSYRSSMLALAAALLLAGPAAAGTIITERSVAAHEAFLASDALQGRGSATRDEAIAAAYVASEFQSSGLVPAPGMDGFLQTAVVIQQQLNGPVALEVGATTVAGARMLVGSGKSISGPLTIATSAAELPNAPIVLLLGPSANPLGLRAPMRDKHIRLLLLADTTAAQNATGRYGGPRLASYLQEDSPPDQPTIVALPQHEIDRLSRMAGAGVTLDVATAKVASTTTNAIGYLKGSDPASGTLLFSAHLDHLGRLPNGTIMHGANDDASGTTAVLELAQALASGKRPRRNILFVCYGSEEGGEHGSTYFGEHPPVPLSQIVANVEFEMIGAQDPKLPRNTLMMTGFDRSNLGEALKRHGALVTRDPYVQQHFFERSDNYSLALQGVVAHTVSGWSLTPTYHQPTDTYANLNIPFMTSAIRSFVGTVEWLANSDFVPAWRPGGRPSPDR